MKINSCCCFDLRTGTLILGIISLVGACGNILSILLRLLALDQLFDIEGPISQMHPDCDAQCMDEVRPIVVYLLAGLLVFNILSLIADSLLLHGVLKNRPALMNFFLGKLILYIFLLTMALTLVVLFMMSSPFQMMALALMLLSLLTLVIYFYHVVSAHKQELLHSKDNAYSSLLEEAATPYIIKS